MSDNDFASLGADAPDGERTPNYKQPPIEKVLVAEVAEFFQQWCGTNYVWEQPSFLTSVTGRKRKDAHKLDIYAQTPRAWKHHRRYPTIAIEAKRESSSKHIRQAWGQILDARRGDSWMAGGVTLWPPAVILFVSWDTWGPSSFLHVCDGYWRTRGMEMLFDRLLWEHGCAILTRDNWGPNFQSNRVKDGGEWIKLQGGT